MPRSNPLRVEGRYDTSDEITSISNPIFGQDGVPRDNPEIRL